MRLPSILRRPLTSAIASAIVVIGVPASAPAQIYWQPPDMSGPAMTGADLTGAVALPNATVAEQQANLVWNLRAALNVAALQCNFEPTLMAAANYNAMLVQHRNELAVAYATLGSYFKRTYGLKVGSQKQDEFGTRLYSGYSTVQAQRTYCQQAGKVSRDALFAPRGNLFKVAQTGLAELRRGLVAQSDRVYGNPSAGFVATLPPLDDSCWKRGEMTKPCATTWEKIAR